MASALEVASLFAVLDLRDNMTPALNSAERSLGGFASKLQSIGGNVSAFGSALSSLGAPFAAAAGAGVLAATNFASAMTDIQAVTGDTAENMVVLGDQLQTIGTNSRFGAQSVAQTFYDIAGGVVDASSRMAVLNAAVSTAQAGNADLGSTTSALIAVMNSYGFSAEQAGFASDVMTRLVGMGVGTMGEFASALPNVTGLAAQSGVSFEDLAAAMAFMSTKGFSASQSATRLQSTMTAFLNPNQRMREALQLMGVSSGSAAIEQYGLAGAVGRLNMALGGSTDAMAQALGSTEALQAAVVLGTSDFNTFSTTFEGGIAGATAAAEAIQMSGPAAQFDLLKSSMLDMAIKVGEALLPALSQIVGGMRPVIAGIAEWIGQNPTLTRDILLIGLGVVGLGLLFSALGTVISGVGVVIAALTSPIGLALALGAALVAAYLSNFGGFRDFIDGQVRPALDKIIAIVGAAIEVLGVYWGEFVKTFNDAKVAADQLIFIISTSLAGAARVMRDAFLSAIGSILDGFNKAVTAAQQLLQIVGLSSGGTSYSSQLAGADAAGLFAGKHGKASGGPVSGGTPYMVGEKGPELFVPNGSGRITPNDQLGGGGATVNIQQLILGDTGHRSAEEVKQMVYEGFIEIMQRGKTVKG